MSRSLLVAFVLSAFAPPHTGADAVVPSERVRTRVIVREHARSESRDVGSLHRGERAGLVASLPGWHRVRLADGSSGFVSSAWTRVVPEEPEVALEMRRVDEVASLRSRVAEWFAPPAEIEIQIRSPQAGRSLHAHLDPKLPVAGFAELGGAQGHYDVVLVLDASTSTNEWAELDVDGDGRGENAWKGDDSIFRAELAAARAFLSTLRSLPGNADGRRIRVGLVTLAGDEASLGQQAERDASSDPERVLALAARDAALELPLTHDYAAVERSLDHLAQRAPAGTTNFAAGIARALIELGAREGAASAPRPGARKIVQFLSDGKPRLPYDRVEAEKAALRAARLAGEAGVTVNTFALGRNTIPRSPNRTLERMARHTGGRFVALESAGEIVSLLDTTAFSAVDRVQLVNRTTNRETDRIATGIDGSFYGEIELVPGANEIRVVALLRDGRRRHATLHVTYERVSPRQELALELARIRAENEALVARIRARLTREMQQVRARPEADAPRRKTLELEVEGRATAPASLD